MGGNYNMLTPKNALNIWLKNNLPNCEYKIFKLAGDASFRQYYRITYENQSQILMDSSFDKQAFQEFMKITHELTSLDLPVPQVYAVNNSESLALIEDFGDHLLLEIANQNNCDFLYKEALNILIKMQNCQLEMPNVPKFTTQQILAELNLFNEWFVNKYLQLEFSNSEKQTITKTFDILVDLLLSLPQTLSHMDYHSRNIIVLKTNKLGIIDYQDARLAPFAYDLVSLLKDCYVKWPQEFIQSLLKYYYDNTKIANTLKMSEFIRAFDICGLQRHLKVLGIFSRLHIRDNKSKYLEDIPLVFHYIINCLKSYNEFADFYEIMTKIRTYGSLGI